MDHQPEDSFIEEEQMSVPLSSQLSTATASTTITPQAPPSNSASFAGDRAPVATPSSMAPESIEAECPTAAKENKTSLKLFNHIQRGADFVSEQVHYHVLELLSSHFGFVAPIPPPTTSSDFVAANDYKAVSAVLGLPNLAHDNLFLKTPLGKICTRFVCSFAGQSGSIKPSPELWDLAVDNWRTIKFSKRLSSIRSVKNDKCFLFIFDLAGMATVPWSLAVYSASAALFVCRLDETMHEEEVVVELVNNGIPFWTLQQKDTLKPASVDRIAPSLIPWRLHDHMFDSTDWEFYRKQCWAVMSLQRARAALLHGGFVWRIGLDYMDRREAARGPWGIHMDLSHMFSMRDTGGIKYVDDELTQDEYDVLCSIYRSYTGFKGQVAQLSWFPSLSMFEGCGLDSGQNLPLSVTKWRDKVHSYADARRANKQLEKWSKEFIEDHVGHL
ncbi:hypothetical protein AN958_11996 [Leucoagaricus sp. SymC.cos]|nr:hypothetical protein AN958_11996 [Leucoagaricus sp. SymC.cos]